MILLDWILIFLIFSFIFSGFLGGFIYSFGSFLGVILGAFLAGIWYEPFSLVIGGGANWAKVIAFIIIFLVVSRLVGFVFYIINKVFKIIAIIPFLGIINRVGGAIFGFIEGVLFLGVVIFFLTHFELGEKTIEVLGSSKLVPFFENVGEILSPLLPRIFSELGSVI